MALAGLALLAGCALEAEESAAEAADHGEAALTSNSSLWGADGELWKPQSRLLDYSYAGYRAGEAAIPNVKEAANVRDFGAVGDGKHDDSQAFLDAIANTAKGAIRVPAGKYVITKRLVISKSNLVLRGDGPDKTILEFPKSLAELDGIDPATIKVSSPYAFGNVYLKLSGGDAGKTVADVTAGAKRGATALKVSGTAGLSVGQLVTLVETDTDNTLAERMYGDSVDPGSDLVGDRLVNFHSRIAAIEGNTLTLERPIPIDVETRWSPKINTFAPKVTESGIEHLTVHFKGSDYRGHFLEAGYNAIQLANVTNSWVRDVRIVNADLGVTVNGSHFCTVDGVEIDTDFDRGAKFKQSTSGHHALWVASRSSDVLFTNFDVQKPFVHDLSTENASIGNVFSNGKGGNLNMDHHRNAPYATLFTNIDLGKGTRAVNSGGSGNRGAHSAAFSTLWNIRSASKFALPTSDFGPLLNFVGVNTSSTSVPNKSWFLEKIAPADLEPANIHEAQREKRTGR
jgi:hypothetical protein